MYIFTNLITCLRQISVWATSTRRTSRCGHAVVRRSTQRRNSTLSVALTDRKSTYGVCKFAHAHCALCSSWTLSSRVTADSCHWYCCYISDTEVWCHGQQLSELIGVIITSLLCKLFLEFVKKRSSICVGETVNSLVAGRWRNYSHIHSLFWRIILINSVIGTYIIQ